MKKNLLKNMTAAIAALFIALLALPQTALAQSNEAYVVENGSTLTFYYDANKATRTGTVYGIDDKRTDDTKVPAWAGSRLDKNERTTKVVFDSSFKDYRPTTTSCWFCICKTLATIEGMENLNTEKVTDMSNMFLGCSSLTSIDVTKFNTAKVINMSGMFSSCSALNTIYCNDNWKSDVVKESTGMFIGSPNLKGFATYDETRTDVSMANPSSGYFTRKSVAYVVENGSTLTFYYDTEKATRTGTGITIYGIDDKRADDTDIPAWAGSISNKNERTTKAVFDSSFKDYKPTTTGSWFFFYTKLETIEGIENLNTEEVTDMSRMFEYCESLSSLDVSKFNTANVTTMSYMFRGCSSLKSLDVSNFNTAKVTSMWSMFCDCSSLTSLDVSKFNTENVISMRYMFLFCKSLTSLDVSKFHTAKVTDMREMFRGCSSLTSIDVTNFNTEEVTDMSSMFYNCSALTTIYCNDNWKSDVVKESEDMFKNCSKLDGAVEYDATKTDVTMANPTTGYFTKKRVAYVVENGSTLTFYYDTNKATRTGTVYGIYDKRTDDTKVPAWAGSKLDKNERTTKVVFDSSFKKYRPTTTSCWFCICKTLATIEGMENLNTEKVTDMSNMFLGCSSLTSIDVTKFNTAKVTDMSGMFSACSALSTIYCNDNWKSDVVKESRGMFIGSRNLKGFATYDETRTDVSMANPSSGYFTRKPVAYVVKNGSTLTFYYDTKKATRTGTVYGIDDKRTAASDIPAWAGTFKNDNEQTTKAVFDSSFKDYKPTTTAYWFYNCTKLETIEGIENLNTEEVTDMDGMFEYCSSLTSLDVSKFNTANVTDMNYMFCGCSSLKSLDVSSFNTAKVTYMTSMFDSCKALTALDLSNFNTENVIYMEYMFSNCSSLTSLNVSNFNTGNVTNMDGMFNGCSALTSIDVTNFNTAKVTYMRGMFRYCSALTSLDVSKFNTANVICINGMFNGCESLTSLDVSNFNTENVKDMDWMFSGCSALTTIYCNDDWTKGVEKGSFDMFYDCPNLKGAVAYDATKTDVKMANPTTGYFTKKDPSGIDAATVDTPVARRGIYTLNGVRLNTSPDNLPAGIYVIDGRKVVKR